MAIEFSRTTGFIHLAEKKNFNFRGCWAAEQILL
jgi:hypothetical protein